MFLCVITNEFCSLFTSLDPHEPILIYSEARLCPRCKHIDKNIGGRTLEDRLGAQRDPPQIPP